MVGGVPGLQRQPGPAVRAHARAQGRHRQRLGHRWPATRFARAASGSGWCRPMKPIELANGQIGAQMTLKLNKANGSVPIDSTAVIRPRSVLGLKYVDLHVGRSKHVFADGGTMPIGQTSVPVQFEDIFQTFNAPTRKAIQNNLVGFGNTLAAPRVALNDTIASLPALFGHLEPVAAVPVGSEHRADPVLRTRSRGSWARSRRWPRPTPACSPRWRRRSRPSRAIRNALEPTIAESPSTEAVTTQSLKVQQPFLVDLNTLGHAAGAGDGGARARRCRTSTRRSRSAPRRWRGRRRSTPTCSRS